MAAAAGVSTSRGCAAVMIPAPTIDQPRMLAPEPEWRGWLARIAREAPPWAYDPEHVTSFALELLPRVCAEIGTGEAVTTLPRPAWWRWPCHDNTAERPIMALAAKPGSYALLFIDRATGAWDCPPAARFGEELVSLAAWRWRTTPAKAAWRLAKICGLKRPLPQ